MGISSQLLISGGLHPIVIIVAIPESTGVAIFSLERGLKMVKICEDCKDLWGEQMHSLRKTHLTRRDCHRFKTIKFCCTLGVKAVTSPENAHLPISLNTFPVWVLSYLNRMQHARQHAGQHLPFVYLSVHSKG